MSRKANPGSLGGLRAPPRVSRCALNPGYILGRDDGTIGSAN
jgi:hypothetical protein